MAERKKKWKTKRLLRWFDSLIHYLEEDGYIGKKDKQPYWQLRDLIQQSKEDK